MQNTFLKTISKISKDYIIYCYIGILLLLWSSAFVGIRYALNIYSAVNVALLRYLTASLVFIVIAFFIKLKLPALRDMPGIIALGTLGFTLYNLALNYGERSVNAGTASFIVNTGPFFTLIFAIFFNNEIIKGREWLGMILAFTGVMIIVWSQYNGIEFNINVLFVLAAAISQALYFVIQKIYLHKYTPLELTSYAVWTGTLLLLLFSRNTIAQVRAAPASHTLAVIYLGVFPGALAYLLFAMALRVSKASQVSAYLFLVPLITVFLSWIFMNEIPSAITLSGGALILAGILMKNRRTNA